MVRFFFRAQNDESYHYDGGSEDILKVEWIVETFFSRWIFVSWRYSRFHALHKLTNSPLDRWIDGLDGSIGLIVVPRCKTRVVAEEYEMTSWEMWNITDLRCLIFE